MQRRRLNAARKEGFSSTVSARALIMRAPMLGSLDHEGISPHTVSAHSRSPVRGLSRTTPTGCVGAML